MDIFTHKHRTMFGKPIQQAWQSIWLIDKLLEKENPDRIAELGCASGILSCYFYTYTQLSGGEFLSFDIKKPIYNNGYTFYQKDLLEEESKEHIARFINGADKGMVLIDAFDPKSKLFNIYAPFFKSGTIILAHDYWARGMPKFRWGFRDRRITVWNHVSKFEPYSRISKKLDCRMLYTKVK